MVCGKFLAINATNMCCACPRSPSGLSPAAHLGDGSSDLILIRKCSRFNFLRFLVRHTNQYDQVSGVLVLCPAVVSGVLAPGIPSCVAGRRAVLSSASPLQLRVSAAPDKSSLKIQLPGDSQVPQPFNPFSPGCDPGVPGSSPVSGSLHGACFSLCLCLCLSVSHE